MTSGPPLRVITDDEISTIEAMAAIGLPTKHIAAMLKMGHATLERRISDTPAVRQAIETGRAKAISNVAKTAYDMAVSGAEPAMTMFYLKCRAGWKEKQYIEHSGAEVTKESRLINDIVILSDDERARRIRFLNDKIRKLQVEAEGDPKLLSDAKERSDDTGKPGT